MAFYIWIYIALIVFWIIIQLSFNVQEKRTNRIIYFQNSLLFLYVIGVGLTIIMGIRSIDVGYDTQMYGRIFSILGQADLFENVSNSVSGYWCYRLICKIVYFFGGNYQIFLFITSAITVGGVIRFIKYTSENYFISVVLYYLSFLYLQAFNGARQCLAISVCLNAYVELERKRYFKSIILSVIACLIHNTAIIMFIIYAIKFINWNHKKLIIYVAGILIVCMYIDPIINLFTYIFPRYAIIYADYLNGNVATMFGGIARGRKALVSVFYIFIILITIYFTDRGKMEDGFANNWTLISLSVIEGIIGIIFRHNTMMLRMQLYFSVFMISCIPNCVERMWLNKRIKCICNIIICVVMIIPFCVQLKENYGRIIPYLVFMHN